MSNLIFFSWHFPILSWEILKFKFFICDTVIQWVGFRTSSAGPPQAVGQNRCGVQHPKWTFKTLILAHGNNCTIVITGICCGERLATECLKSLPNTMSMFTTLVTRKNYMLQLASQNDKLSFKPRRKEGIDPNKILVVATKESKDFRPRWGFAPMSILA